MVLRHIPNHDSVHRDGDWDQCGIDQGKSTNTPDSKWLKYGKQCGGELVQQRYGSNNHEPTFYRLCSVPPCSAGLVSGLARQQVQSMRQQRKHRSQGAFRTRWASREVEDKALTRHTTHSTPKSGKRRVLRSILPNQLGKSGNKSIADRQRRFRSNVASRKARSACSHNQRNRRSRLAHGRDQALLLIRHNAQLDNRNSRSLKHSLDSRTRQVGLDPGKTPVARRNHDRFALS